MRAVLFPGQGSQFVGMASDFYKKFDSVKKVFRTVDSTLGFSLSNLILNGPEDELKLTQNTQPAIMTVGVSIFNVLNQHLNLILNDSSTKYFSFFGRPPRTNLKNIRLITNRPRESIFRTSVLSIFRLLTLIFKLCPYLHQRTIP